VYRALSTKYKELKRKLRTLTIGSQGALVPCDSMNHQLCAFTEFVRVLMCRKSLRQAQTDILFINFTLSSWTCLSKWVFNGLKPIV